MTGVERRPLPRPLAFPSRVVRETMEVRDLVGRGAFGDVWACVHRNSGEELACKVVDRTAMARPDDLDREIKILSRLREEGGHPGVLQLLEVWEHRNKTNLITEFCSGGDLFSYVHLHGAVPEPQAKSLFTQLASALAFCHSHGVVHCDVKPENVLLDTPGACRRAESEPAASEGDRTDCVFRYPSLSDEPPRDYGGTVSTAPKLKLADFGLAMCEDEGAELRGYRGTKSYAAPEVIEGRSYDAAADVWSLGAVLFVIVTGRIPLLGSNGEDVKGRWRSALKRCSKEPHLVCKGLSPLACDLLKNLLAEEPSRRPTASEALQHPWLCRENESAAGDNRDITLQSCSLEEGNRFGIPVSPTSPLQGALERSDSEISISTISDSTIGSVSTPNTSAHDYCGLP